MVEIPTTGPLQRLRRLILINIAVYLAMSAFLVVKLGSQAASSPPPQVILLLVCLGLALVGFWDLAPASHLPRLALIFSGFNAAFFLSSFSISLDRTWGSWMMFAPFHMILALLFLREGYPAASSEPTGERRIRSWLAGSGDEAAREERKRLARDLHDSIKQQLFSIKVSAAAAEARWESDPSGAREALADVRRSAQAAMVETQALLRQLRPEAVAVVGFVEALREQCEALGYRTGAQVELELGNLPPEHHLSHDTRENLFRIAQEAFSNIARHARARNVSVWFGTMKNEEAHLLVLRIRDDGQGFDLATTTNGMGLRNIKERAESLPAAMVLESSPSRGTELRIYLRLPELTSPEERSLGGVLPQERQALVFAALWVLINFDDPVWSFYAIIHMGLVALSTRRNLLRISEEVNPVLVRTLYQVRSFLRSFALLMIPWWMLIVWTPDGGTPNVWERLRLALMVVSGALALREAWGFFSRYQEGPQDRRAGNPVVLAALLVCSLAGVFWILLQGDPGGVARIVLRTSAALCLAWWLWTLTRWGKGMTQR